jgi:hypothetical protein
LDKHLEQVRKHIACATLKGRSAIEARLRSIAKQYKLDSHVLFDVSEAGFSYHISDQQTALAAAVDGFRQSLERIRILVAQGQVRRPATRSACASAK